MERPVRVIVLVLATGHAADAHSQLMIAHWHQDCDMDWEASEDPDGSVLVLDTVEDRSDLVRRWLVRRGWVAVSRRGVVLSVRRATHPRRSMWSSRSRGVVNQAL